MLLEETPYRQSTNDIVESHLHTSTMNKLETSQPLRRQATYNACLERRGWQAHHSSVQVRTHLRNSTNPLWLIQPLTLAPTYIANIEPLKRLLNIAVNASLVHLFQRLCQCKKNKSQWWEKPNNCKPTVLVNVPSKVH